MKKKIKWICIIIVMLIIVALVIIEFLRENDHNHDIIIDPGEPYEGPTNIVQIEEAKNQNHLMIIPENFNEAMKSYQGKVNQGELKRKFYKFIVKNIPQIYDETKTLNDEQIAEYYDQNISKINEMNIYNKNEFINLCSEIKNNVTDASKTNIPYSSIQLFTCENRKDYYSFSLRLEYSKTNIIQIKVKLSNNDNKIEFEKYDELKDVYLSYNGPVTKQEIKNHLNYVATNGKKVYDSCKDLNLNQILQYYDLNKEALNKLGIYSNRDYLLATNQFVRVSFSKNPKYLGLTVKPNSTNKKDKYTAFQVNLNYSTDESLKLIVNLINSSEFINEENPKVKITAEINEESE